MWEKDFEEFVRGSILGLAKAAAGLIEQAFSVGALTPEWWVTVVGGQVTTTVAGSEVDAPAADASQAPVTQAAPASSASFANSLPAG